MTVQFGSANMAQLANRPNTIVYDKASGVSLALNPAQTEAIEGGRLRPMLNNFGQPTLDPYGKPRLQVNPSNEPVYFKLQGINTATRQPTSLIAPFDNLGLSANSNQLDIIG